MNEMQRNKCELTESEIRGYQAILLAKRDEILGNVSIMEHEALLRERSDLSNMPIHMADAGTDNYEIENTLGLMDSERKLLGQIDEALQRIEEGTYGICAGDGHAIPKQRLDAIPWAKFCVGCASLLEKTIRTMKGIRKGFITPSSALAIKPRQVRYYEYVDKAPLVGDVIFGTVTRIGQHTSLENVHGRIHTIHRGTKGIFVFGNRYAPDYYEGLVPDEMIEEVDLVARSGMVGIVKTRNSKVKDPTTVHVLGYVCDESGHVLNTRDFPLIKPRTMVKKQPRAKMILVCGTSMNSGKSLAAAACCRALASAGYKVRASKVTGTASLKDILHMNDSGASPYSDFTYLGYPSTYLLEKDQLLDIFNQLDLKYANNPKNFWVVELADGVIQRETAMLLNCPEVTSRIHKLIFCASDAFGAIGGLGVLTRYGLEPDALSGVCSSSPLFVRELSEFTSKPFFNSIEPDISSLVGILLGSNKYPVVCKSGV